MLNPERLYVLKRCEQGKIRLRCTFMKYHFVPQDGVLSQRNLYSTKTSRGLKLTIKNKVKAAHIQNHFNPNTGELLPPGGADFIYILQRDITNSTALKLNRHFDK